MVTKVRGRFPVQSGTVTIAENPLESSVVAVIDVAGVNSGEAGRDEHLRNADFFEVEKYPTITFRSTKVEDAGDGEYKVTGDLTIKDVTRPVTLDLEYLGTIASPFGDQRAGFSASTEISRKDWGIEFNMALEGRRRRGRRQDQAQHRSREPSSRSNRSTRTGRAACTGPRQHVAPWSTSTRSCRV